MTAGFFKVLALRPHIGRGFSEEEDTPAGQPTVILTNEYWQNQFGGEPSVIGKRIVVNDLAREIIGVMPQDFRFLI